MNTDKTPIKKFNIDTDNKKLKEEILKNKENYKSKELVRYSGLYLNGIGEKSIKVNNLFIAWDEFFDELDKFRKNMKFEDIEHEAIKALILFFINLSDDITKNAKIKKIHKFDINDDISKVKEEILSNKIAYKKGFIDGIGEKSIKTISYTSDKSKQWALYTEWTDIEKRLKKIKEDELGFVDLSNNDIVDLIIKQLFKDPVEYDEDEDNVRADESLDYTMKYLTIASIRHCKRYNEKLNYKRIMEIIRHKHYDTEFEGNDVIKYLIENFNIVYYDNNYEKIVQIEDNQLKLMNIPEKIDLVIDTYNQELILDNEFHIFPKENELFLYHERTNQIVLQALRRNMLTLNEIEEYGRVIDGEFNIFISEDTFVNGNLTWEEYTYDWLNSTGRLRLNTALDLMKKTRLDLQKIVTEFNRSQDKPCLFGFYVDKTYYSPYTFKILKIHATTDDERNPSYRFVIEILDYPVDKEIPEINTSTESYRRLDNGNLRHEFLIRKATRDKFIEKINEIVLKEESNED